MNNLINNVDSLLDSFTPLPNIDGIIDASISSFTKDRSPTPTIFRDNNGPFLNESPSDVNNPDLKKEIYRFKFTDSFMEELFKFSKIHQLDDRKDFKEAWIVWTNEYSFQIKQEIDRLNHLGFQGDILDKMFKSARYYFRKRNYSKDKEFFKNKKEEEKEEINNNKNRKYQCSSKLLLETMNLHIKKILCLEDSIKKPSIAFLDFCKENKDLLKDEINDLNQLGITELKDVLVKIKKTYKNKYFSILNK